MRITWKREADERGLARVCQTERGYDLRIDGVRVAQVSPLYGAFSRKRIGYYWYAGDKEKGIPHRNTSHDPVTTIEEAKDACKEYVLRCLKGVKA